MNQSAASPSEVLVGHVERVTFHSDESGFCVLRVKARGHRDLVTTIRHAAMISAGGWITASMVDVMLMQSLGKAIPVGAALLIVGDIDQSISVA